MWRAFADGLDSTKYNTSGTADNMLGDAEAAMRVNMRRACADTESPLSRAFAGTTCIRTYITDVAVLYADERLTPETREYHPACEFTFCPLWKVLAINKDPMLFKETKVGDRSPLLAMLLLNFMEAFLKSYQLAISVEGVRVLYPDSFAKSTDDTGGDSDDEKVAADVEEAMRGLHADAEEDDDDDDNDEGEDDDTGPAAHLPPAPPKRPTAKVASVKSPLMAPLFLYLVGATLLAMINSVSEADANLREPLARGLMCTKSEAARQKLDTKIIDSRGHIAGRLVCPTRQLLHIIEELEDSLGPLLANVRLLALFGGELYWEFVRNRVRTS